MLSKGKAFVGGLMMVGAPLAFAALFAGLGYRYANQDVHDVWAELRGAHAAVVHHDYTHSGGGIATVAAAFAIAWLAITFLFVLGGSRIISLRNVKWDV